MMNERLSEAGLPDVLSQYCLPYLTAANLTLLRSSSRYFFIECLALGSIWKSLVMVLTQPGKCMGWRLLQQS